MKRPGSMFLGLAAAAALLAACHGAVPGNALPANVASGGPAVSAVNAAPGNATVRKTPAYPGYCQIEIINSSKHDVEVYGTFDDGDPLDPFRIRVHDAPHYISLLTYGYCQYGMFLSIESIQGPRNTSIYAAWTDVNSIVRIFP